MAKKKAAKKSSVKESEAPALPSQVPLPGSMQTYTPVPDEVLAQHMRQISLDQVRKYISDKVKTLQSYQQDCPTALFSDIENVIVYFQVATIEVVVKSYIKLMETLRFWWEWCKEKEREVERNRKLLQRTLMQTIRSNWNTETDGRISNDAIENKARTDKDHEAWLAIQEHWEYLGNQIHQLITSAQTEILVQASMWERAADLGQTPLPPGAVQGQAVV